MALSFKLGSFVAGGGLADGDYIFDNFSVVLWDYEGKISNPIVALKAVCHSGKLDPKTKTVVPSGEPIIQHWSIGGTDKFSINETGTGVDAIGTQTALGKSSNFYIFLENLVNAGFDESLFNDDVTVFDGLQAHVTNIPAPQRNLPKSNLITSENAQPQRERSIPVINVIHQMPGSKKTAAPAPAKVKAAAASAAASTHHDGAEGDLTELLATTLSGVLNGTNVARSVARVHVFKALNKASTPAPVRDAVIEIFKNDTVLDNVLAGIGEGYTISGTDIIPV